MSIQQNDVVTLAYTLYDQETGDIIEQATAENPLAYLHGNYGNIFLMVEEVLHGKNVGDEIEVVLPPEEAFGEYEEELVREEPADIFPQKPEVGMMFEADDPETGDTILFTVEAADGKTVRLNGNHPLAGRTLRFAAKVLDTRQANAEEIEHGHVHGAHGHHH